MEKEGIPSLYRRSKNTPPGTGKGGQKKGEEGRVHRLEARKRKKTARSALGTSSREEMERGRDVNRSIIARPAPAERGARSASHLHVRMTHEEGLDKIRSRLFAPQEKPDQESGARRRKRVSSKKKKASPPDRLGRQKEPISSLSLKGEDVRGKKMPSNRRGQLASRIRTFSTG